MSSNATFLLETQPLTISSREIARLCEKKHAHVCRDIRVMFEALSGNRSKSGSVETNSNAQLKSEPGCNEHSYISTYLDAKNEQRLEYHLPQDLLLTLVSGYSVQLRKRIIDRWLELERERDNAQSPDPVFSDNPPPASAAYDPWSTEGMERINSKLALVREVRRIFGSPEAKLLWTRVGLPQFPEKVIDGFDDVKDDYARFVTEVFVFTGCPSDMVTASDAYEGYKIWCGHHKTLPVSEARFFKGMAALSGYLFDKPDGGVATFQKVKASHSFYSGLTIDTPFLRQKMALVSSRR